MQEDVVTLRDVLLRERRCAVERRRAFDDASSVSCCAQSRIHLIDKVLKEVPSDDELSTLRAENARLRDALEWIFGASNTGTNRCSCGRPTGVQALHEHARTALAETENHGGSRGREEPNRSETEESDGSRD